ncbi:MAG TPA: hypothetical protein VGQ52_19595 [Gemmatimonadaceae bacterium]|nr:hypothetical protein [Gemmatimonadaceae bacterium]
MKVLTRLGFNDEFFIDHHVEPLNTKDVTFVRDLEADLTCYIVASRFELVL